MNTSTNDLAARLAALSKRSTKELRAAYEKQHGRSPSGISRTALIKTLATFPMSAPMPRAATPRPASPAPTPHTAGRKTGARDPRLPSPGTVLERTFKGKVHKVTVRADGLEYAGKTYRSLTAAAKVATGYASISGTLFFGIAHRKGAESKPATETPAPANTEKAPRAPKAKRARGRK